MFTCPDCFSDTGLKRRIVALRPGEPHQRCDFHPRKKGIALSAISPILSEFISNSYRHADDDPWTGESTGEPLLNVVYDLTGAHEHAVADTLHTLIIDEEDVWPPDGEEPFFSDAYGWSGPWSKRRGFDSLVQMSSGIAEYAMRRAQAKRPVPLPVQALDHTTGYLMAASVLRALTMRQRDGRVLSARLSLARVAALLVSTKGSKPFSGIAPARCDDFETRIEETAWGRARRMLFPLRVEGLAVKWRHPAGELRAVSPRWQ